jgi:hypothetical protein
MSVALGDKWPPSPQSRSGLLGLEKDEGEESSGRPTQVTIPEKVDAIHSMILDN